MAEILWRYADPGLDGIEKHLARGGRLDRKQGLSLFGTDDLPGLGHLADTANRARNGNRVYYIHNVHLNYTNICVNHCRFCAYSKRSSSQQGAFFLSADQVIAEARAGFHEGVSEFHIVGGCHPDAPLEYYEDLLSGLAAEFPGVHLQAFTAVEIEHISRKAGLSLENTLSRFRKAGLGSIPGGGGEIFSPEVRKRICPEKISGERYLEVMRRAHKMGIRSNATMLFGHLETAAHRVDHLLAVRELQDETGGFDSFIPLLFHPLNTGMDGIRKAGGVEVLRTIAASRLILDNFDHIKSFWIMLGLPLTQVSLFFGADDVNGTVLQERITHDAGARTPRHVPGETLVRLIQEAGRTPVARDTLYNEVRRQKSEDRSQEPGEGMKSLNRPGAHCYKA